MGVVATPEFIEQVHDRCLWDGLWEGVEHITVGATILPTIDELVASAAYVGAEPYKYMVVTWTIGERILKEQLDLFLADFKSVEGNTLGKYHKNPLFTQGYLGDWKGVSIFASVHYSNGSWITTAPTPRETDYENTARSRTVLLNF